MFSNNDKILLRGLIITQAELEVETNNLVAQLRRNAAEQLFYLP
jgi:hypothetical protein